MAALGGDGRDVQPPVVAERGDDADEVDLAVGPPSQPAVGDRRDRRRNGSGWPIIRRSAGRASTSKLTSELTGFPGRPNTGTPSIVPKANGLAGLIATCIQRMLAMRPSTALTTSYSPMLTPPLVTIASADTAASRSVRSSVSSSSATTP